MESIAVPALAPLLATIPDYRAARGQRHPWVPLLLLICVAMLCGARSQSAIAAWGRDYGAPWLRRLGFTRNNGPSQATVQRIFAGIAYVRLERVLTQWAEQVFAQIPPAGLEGIAVDGKTLRGSTRRGATTAHLFAALSHRVGIVLGQQAVGEKTNEIRAADALLLTLVLEGRVVTADALLTQRHVAEVIGQRGGDYLFVVKDNQPTLLWEVMAYFTDPPPTVQDVATTDQHGGRIETRRLTTVTAVPGYSDWPRLAQVLRLERRVVAKQTGQVLRAETSYAVTSLPPAKASPVQLLALWRGHWTIENRLHYIRDTVFAEDLSQAYVGTVPACMAAFRNLAISLLRVAGVTNMFAATRRYAAQPALALAAVGLQDFE
jgi:predicted transposase YbfD/YdcC